MPGLSFWGVFLFLDPQPFAWPPALAPSSYLRAMAPYLYLPALAPNLYLPAMACNSITSPGPEFSYTDLFSSPCICIYRLGPRFILSFRGLNLDLPYYW